ncbi:MAG: hypothetical protein K0S65_3550, partial [Labilithrix sp.]|nr:hypothetical protein [Labilithrix sp.]
MATAGGSDEKQAEADGSDEAATLAQPSLSDLIASTIESQPVVAPVPSPVELGPPELAEFGAVELGPPEAKAPLSETSTVGLAAESPVPTAAPDLLAEVDEPFQADNNELLAARPAAAAPQAPLNEGDVIAGRYRVE